MNNKKKFVRFLITTAVFCIAAAVFIQVWNHYMYRPWTRDARVRAEVVKVAPDVSGIVERVYVKDNQPVKKGDLLMLIDPSRYRLAVTQAHAEVSSSAAQIITAEARIKTAEARIQSADAQIAAAEADHGNADQANERRRSVADNVVSPEEKERIASELQQAAARLSNARARRAESLSQLNEARSALTEAQSVHARALSGLELAKLNLERTEVRASVNGYIANLNVFQGDYANAGTPKLSVIDRDSFWVYGYFEETKIPFLKVGDRAEVELMSGQPVLYGRVESIAHGIADRDNPQGADGLANVNPTFSWVRLAQRVPVRIKFDELPQGDHIAAGMTCSVIIRPEDEPKPKH